MLGQRHRRWANIKTTSCQRIEIIVHGLLIVSHMLQKIYSSRRSLTCVAVYKAILSLL